MRPTSGSRASGATCIVRWILPARPSTFSSGAKQDAAAAKRFLAKALGRQNHPVPRVINTDKHAAYLPAIVQLKDEGVLEPNCQHRPAQYLNNVLEQDHRAIKRRINASQHFRSFWGAWRTIAGYEAIHMIRKGQACWSAAGAKVGLLHRFIVGMFGLEV
jgi:transposase, IS6 family